VIGKKLIKKLLMFTVIALLLSGCVNGQSTEEKIYQLLENVVKIEKDFKDQQQPLLELEQKEKDIYDQILELGLKEKDQINSLADEAINLSAERKNLLDKEKESIDKSKTEFEGFKNLISEIKDESLKEEASALYSIMEERYEIHKQLYDKYVEAIKLDEELYNMLKDEDVSLDILEPQIEKINSIYSEVYSLNDQFNELTSKYNDGKIKFYQNAGLNISVEK